MQFRIDGNPDQAELTVALQPDEKVRCEAGAMSRMAEHLDMRITTGGGFLKGLLRSVAGGESLVQGEFSAPQGGWITLAPRAPGTILHQRLEQRPLWLAAGAYLASSTDVRLRTRWGGLRGLFGGAGLFVLQAEGPGDVFVSATGTVVERELTSSDGELIVDTGHVVAWEDSVEYRITGMGGIKSTLFSGEGLVTRFSGQGKVWLQSRTLGEFAGWIRPYLRG